MWRELGEGAFLLVEEMSLDSLRLHLRQWWVFLATLGNEDLD